MVLGLNLAEAYRPTDACMCRTYEEARRYFAEAMSDGYFADHNEVSIFMPHTCLAMIERYEQR